MDKPTFNNINLQYLIALHEQCREGLINSANQFKDIVIEMSLKHEKMSKHILMDLFAC